MRARKNLLGVFAPGHSILESMEPFIDESTPHHEELPKEGKLHVSVTKNKKNVVISKFDSVEELKNV